MGASTVIAGKHSAPPTSYRAFLHSLGGELTLRRFARTVRIAPILLKNYGLRGFAVADSLWSLRPG